MNKKIVMTGALLLGCSASAIASEFSFDHPGLGVGIGITPVGKFAYEQTLANVNHWQSQSAGQKQKGTTVTTDMLLRTGIAKDWEAQIGWQGFGWSKVKAHGQSDTEHGYGDVLLAVKKAIDLDDEDLSMTLIGQVTFANGDDAFSVGDELYSLGSVVGYNFSDDISTYMSMYYEVQDGTWSVTAVPTLEYKFTEQLSGFSELIYNKTEGQHVNYSLDSGLMYAVSDRLQLDATMGTQLSGRDKSYQTSFGFSVLF